MGRQIRYQHRYRAPEENFLIVKKIEERDDGFAQGMEDDDLTQEIHDLFGVNEISAGIRI